MINNTNQLIFATFENTLTKIEIEYQLIIFPYEFEPKISFLLPTLQIVINKKLIKEIQGI